MKIERARRISDSFAGNVSLKVCQFQRGLLVQYRKRSSYFTCESSFWAYIFTLAGLPAVYQPGLFMNRCDDRAGHLFARDFFDRDRSYAYGRLRKNSLRANEPARAHQYS